jgi:hypothetical protein
MSKANTLDPNRAILFSDEWIDGGVTDRVVSRWIPMRHLDVVSFQLLSGSGRTVSVATGDAVTAAENWTFKSANFSAKDIGATLTIAGSVSNDGDYEIDAVVTDGITVHTTGAATPETFDPETVTVTVTRPARAGSWDVEVSNIWDPDKNNGELPFNFPPSDITSEFSPAIVDVVVAAPETHNQPVNAALFGYAAIRLGFTPSGVEPGVISAAVCAKGNR